MNQGLMLGQEDSASVLVSSDAGAGRTSGVPRVGSSAWLRSLGAANDEVFVKETLSNWGSQCGASRLNLPWPSFVAKVS